MQTVKAYFSDPDAAAVFSPALNDLQEWSGYETLDGEDVAEIIVEKYGNQYINGAPTYAGFMKAVNIWHTSRKYYFDGLFATTQFEYNPIYNVDETTTETNTRTPNLTHAEQGTTAETDTRKTEVTHGHTVNVTSSGTDSAETTETGENTDSVTGQNQVTTYNSNTFLDDTKNTQSGTSSNERTAETTGTTSTTTATTNAGKDTTQNSGGTSATTSRTATETGTDITEFSRERVGNIGVTSSQQLIDAERKIRDFDILDIWLERFAERFFIPIYESEVF